MAGSPLTKDQITFYDKTIQNILRNQIIGRSLIALAPGSPYGFGVQQIEYSILKDMSPAELSMTLGESMDMIGLSTSSIEIPIIHKEFGIDRRNLASSKRMGLPLDTTTASVAADKVAELENELIVKGWDPAGGTNYAYNGLYGAASNDYSTGTDWGTAGNATKSIRAAVKLLLKSKVMPGYNCVINEDQYAEVLGPRGTTSDITELMIIKDMLKGGDGRGGSTPFGNGGGNVFVNPVMTAGTGLVAAQPNVMFADLVVAQDAKTEYERLSKTGNYFGRVFECLIPRIKRTDAFCKMSSI